MKTTLIFILCLFLINGLSAQDTTNDKQNRKEAKKAYRDSIANSEYQLISNMVDSMQFVLEANFMANRTGSRVPVSSNLNFIKIDSTHAVIQTGRNTGVGSNGVGGVTAEGNVTSYKVKKDEKHKSFYVSMEVMTNIGMYSVFMNITASGRATARLSGLWPGQLTWDGQLIQLDQTRTYQGKTL